MLDESSPSQLREVQVDCLGDFIALCVENLVLHIIDLFGCLRLSAFDVSNVSYQPTLATITGAILLLFTHHNIEDL
jgi:hypothetical protein